MSTSLHVWGEGAPTGELLEQGEPSEAAFRAALGDVKGDRRWDPRENSSWAVTVTLSASEQSRLKDDPAVYGWCPA